ncbi:MAG TPA: DUF1343 domain-containing protein [Thermoprotei archaeon]|nr:DUF1343 domain-containing protein [Thermoprotei archaeon]
MKVVFSPEHGLMGDFPDGVKVKSYFDTDFNVNVYSLYGYRYEPPIDVIKDLDAVIYDIQDVGARWYTFISTLYHTVRSCSKAGVKLYILDRPNPVTGVRIEGPILEDSFRSFIGIYNIPVRYGLTPGELACLYNVEENFSVDIDVIKLNGWSRRMWFDDTDLLWIPPSPNIPTFMSALIYLGTCLFEGTNISEGRGTTKPFEYIGAPWINPRKLTIELNKIGMKGVKFRPIYFRPNASKYSDEKCGGIHILVTDRERFKPLETALHIISIIRKMYPDKFEWRYSGGKYWFDMLIGNNYVRKMIEEEYDVNEIKDRWIKDLNRFKEKVKKYFLYT